MSIKEKISEQFDTLTQEERLNEIVLFNDDVNTFEHVIESLVAICNHTHEQAEQCALLVHYKGKCTVKTGSYDELEPLCSRLLEVGLSAEIV
ncbi:MAG: ATP-dependent Clp protease adaptor ClpS [Flavobacteriaceae bacterium]|jgi:ATP-dependent Clp protease adaptor protein ClpS|nr:ATP-dependent Clp protease adaptor ClpS [Flavobacteriaceae bacterium]|tara:strand:- start:105 stop:380 length:276 start_codon:yes stop_codon:yes gene_type:complete